MNILLWTIAFCGLVMTIVSPCLVFMGKIELTSNYTWMGLGMILWFGARLLMKSTSETMEE